MKEPESGIAYKISGNSNSYLVLLHGYCETKNIWDHFIPHLDHTHTVLTPDLPGFGESEIIPGEFTIDQVADRIHQWLSNLNVKRFKVIGHSLGGYVVMSLAAQYPEQLSGIGLFHSTSYADSAEKKANRLKAIDFLNKYGVERFTSSLIPGLFYRKEGSEQEIATLTEEASKCPLNAVTGYALAMRNRPDRRTTLYEFDRATLFIAGSNDAAVSPKDSSEQIDNLNQNAIKMMIDGIGHMGMFEAKEVTLDLAQRFAKAKG